MDLRIDITFRPRLLSALRGPARLAVVVVCGASCGYPSCLHLSRILFHRATIPSSSLVDDQLVLDIPLGRSGDGRGRLDQPSCCGRGRQKNNQVQT